MSYVPAGPIARIVDRYCTEADMSITILEDLLEMGEGALMKACNGSKDWMEFDTADRVITFIDPFLWRHDEELSDIYQGFDFSYLDLHRPTSEEADELPLLDCVGSRHAAAVMGVSQYVVQGQRRKRAAA